MKIWCTSVSWFKEPTLGQVIFLDDHIFFIFVLIVISFKKFLLYFHFHFLFSFIFIEIECVGKSEIMKRKMKFNNFFC